VKPLDIFAEVVSAMFDIWRNFLHGRRPMALVLMLGFMAFNILIVAIQAYGKPFFWPAIGMVFFGWIFVFPSFVYLCDRGYIGGKPRRATDELFGKRK